MAQFVMKRHVTPLGSSILAISDPELIGKSLEDTDKGISFQVTEHFYGTELFDEKEAIEALSAADNANIMGNLIVEVAINHNLISPKNVITISGVKHAQIYKID